MSNLNNVLDVLKNGGIICIADNEDLENEIDMCCLAKHATTENINYMVKNARGLVCIPMTDDKCKKIGFEKMDNYKIPRDKLATPFYQSIDLNNGSTGVSPSERGKTARKLIEDDVKLTDFVSPGHLFPLKACEGLLKERLGHTEGSVTLATLCGEKAAIICEIIKDDGNMLTLKDYEEWNKGKNLPLITIKELIDNSAQN